MTFETIFYSLIIPFFSSIIFFFTFFNSIAEKLRDWIWFPSRLSAEKLLSWSFRSSSAGEKTHCRKREKGKKTFSPNVPLHIRSHSKTPLRYVREENYLAVQRERAMRISFFQLPWFYLDDWGDLWKCTEESINLLKRVFFFFFASCFDFRALFN